MKKSADNLFLESFDRLTGTRRAAPVAEENLGELKSEVLRVFGSFGHRRNLIRQDLTEVAVAAAESSRFGHLTESKEGAVVLAKVIGEIVSEMVGDALIDVAKIRRRA